MTEFTLSLDGHAVVANGTVVCTDKQTVSLSEVGHDYVIDIVFESDTEGEKKQSVVFEARQGNGVRVRLKNLDGPLGQATKEPLLVGFDDNDNTDLNLYLAVYSFGAAPTISKVLHYTLIKRPRT
jgi:hypothetical protein